MTTPAQRIQSILGVRSMTRQTLASKLDADKGAVSRYLNGDLDLERAKGAVSITRIAEVLGVPESSLLTGDPCPMCGVNR